MFGLRRWRNCVDCSLWIFWSGCLVNRGVREVVCCCRISCWCVIFGCLICVGCVVSMDLFIFVKGVFVVYSGVCVRMGCMCMFCCDWKGVFGLKCFFVVFLGFGKFSWIVGIIFGID